MARKEKIFTVTANGRDKGKQFKITEMAARAGEEWAFRVASALIGTGIQIPSNITKSLVAMSAEKPEGADEATLALHDSIMGSGMVALAKFGITALAKVPFDYSKPLMDELLSCVEYVASPGVVIPLDDSHIEESSTYFRLKVETFKLHVAFLQATAD
ncbi:hypothetical protein [Winslowiella toletana]|uniref:hypothetical protein n=1 Tax=Winslowiella toletana TaxID=92490 RepID=UPI0028BE14A2|nr:hypothetical protein [Winslowiella toletana]WNN42790.1 hypothetical protein RIN69_13815 [Winslowiella toletana]